jgi:precorrin isomerase
LLPVVGDTVHGGSALAALRDDGADLKRFTPEEEIVAVRVIHSCGMVEVAADVAFSKDAAIIARQIHNRHNSEEAA